MTTVPDVAPAQHRLARHERIRLWWWLLRLETAMQDYPAREARRIRRELRASLRDEAAAVGLDEALRGVGSPRRLAAAYFAELDRERPRWTDGAVLAGLVGLVLPVHLWLAWQLGALNAIEAMGGGVVETSWLGTPVTLTHTEDTIAMQTSVGWGGLLLSAGLVLVTFALGSRVWRLRGA
ncbi:hypothetical protein [Cellulomonas sp. KH9]|uniref:hypothetical protein n=1 Tax=Cellulomonas sp. KH9 TaxID=1855324 RepID=UPI0008EB645C|nr:hypothetical protein [Cellulomonas sp. KH9]SFJ81425.1 Uncharacterized membrane protein [Cellulomonas sp. KH9]